MLTYITERKNVEESLLKSEEHYRMLFFNMTDGFGLVEVIYNNSGKPCDFRCIEVNPAFECYLGMKREQMLGKTILETLPNVNPTALEKYAEVATSGKPIHFEILSQETNKYLDIYAFRPEKGKLALILRDITEKKEVEIKLAQTLNNLENLVEKSTVELQNAYNLLKESEKSLAEAQRMSHIGNVDWNLVTGEVRWSDELYLIFGRDPQKPGATYKEYLSYIHPDDRNRVDNTIQKALHGEPAAGEYSIVLENGKERKIFSNIEVIFNDKNCPIRVKGTFQDITERKTAEEQIRKLANIVESSNDAIGTISPDGIVTSWNKAGEHVYGFSLKEIIGKSISIVAPLHLSEETKELSELVNQGKKIHNYETKRVRKDGKIIDISMTLSPVFDLHGKLIATSFISRDISESKKAEEKLFQEKKKAEVANRTKSDFLANMSHELRTPLNSIIGFSDMLNDQLYGELNERQLKAIGNISKGGKHLLSLINNILDLSKVEAGQLKLDYKDFELPNKLNMIRNLLSPIANRKNIKIEIISDSEFDTIHADEDKFTQIMYNLVDNAVKFSYENNLIVIEARKKRDMVEIMVIDYGIGIKAEDQHKLFRPFSQIDSFSSKRSQGTGLGLSLVKQFVKMHGGYVWFRSNLGEGSTFAFTIPTKKMVLYY